MVADSLVFFPCGSGISSFARAARPAFRATAPRTVKPAAFRPLNSRWASTTGAGDGKIHQVSRRCPRACPHESPGCDGFPPAERSRGNLRHEKTLQELTTHHNTTGHRCRRRWLVLHPPAKIITCPRWTFRQLRFFPFSGARLLTPPCAVKFDTAKLPAILNSLETDNQGQKLVLEVAVCQWLFFLLQFAIEEHTCTDRSFSNISVRMSSAALLWTVRATNLPIDF